ncbi:MAG TPA: hypothetical protein VJ552_09360 [Sediminibacterium sp.]|nr:hypothetical protein [Sediminibacterium sp.]
MAANCSGPLPLMSVGKVTVLKRRRWHFQLKTLALSEAMGKPETEEMPGSAADFLELCNQVFTVNQADGIRIYMAAFPADENEAWVPFSKGGTLTLVYAPCLLNQTTGTYKDIGQGNYFILHPSGGCVKIDQLTAERWIISEYRNNPLKLPLLTNLVHNAGGDPAYTDTISVFHTREEFEQLKAEVECQEAAGVVASFTSYTDTEEPGVNSHYLNRMTVEYYLTDANDKLINITARPRLNYTVTEGEVDVTAFNNGTLCPPYNCAGDTTNY